MIIHNATFMVPKERESELILWLKGATAVLSRQEGSNPRISAMREAGGVSHELADASSVAFQLEFPDVAAAKNWSAKEFAKLAQEFNARYGVESMVFTSLFEIL